MLKRVFRRGKFPTSIVAVVPPNHHLAAAAEKASTPVRGKGKRGTRTKPAGEPVVATAAVEAIAVPAHQATALLLTSKEVQGIQKSGRSGGTPSETLGSISLTASSVVGFQGRLGEATWTTVSKHAYAKPPPTPQPSDVAATAALPPTTTSTTRHPTVLVGLSRSAKDQAMMSHCLGSERCIATGSSGLLNSSGLTDNTSVTISEYRRAVTLAVQKAKQAGNIETLRIDIPTSVSVTCHPSVWHSAQVLSAVEVAEKTACFAVTGAYGYTRLQSGTDTATATGAAQDAEKDPASEKKKIKRKRDTSGASFTGLQRVLIDTTLKQDVETGCVIGSAVNDARNLGNLREDEGTPEFYVEWMHQQLKLHRKIRVRMVLRGKAIADAGLELLYNVGKGSIHTPYVMVLEYTGDKKSKDAIALVGKGVTFDCGGLNIKPYGSMETMHTDMMGAATVLSTLNAAAALDLPINLVVAVGLVENAIGPGSYHPGCILRSLSGRTVEVRNTDAEGRLVMADLFTYLYPNRPGGYVPSSGRKSLKLSRVPTTMIDVATLTGAIIVSLGSHRAGCFSNTAGLSTGLVEAGSWSGEEVWPMPVGLEHAQQVQGRIADLINTPPGREGGSCTAAAFLAHFVPPGVRWAHLDIAGPADAGDRGKCHGVFPPGVTGFGVQLLIDYLRRGLPPKELPSVSPRSRGNNTAKKLKNPFRNKRQKRK